MNTIKDKSSVMTFFLALLIFLVTTTLTGCSMQSIEQHATNVVVEPNNVMQNRVSNNTKTFINKVIGNGVSQEDFQSNTTFYDKRTGQAITQAQYYANNITDAVKFYGIYITVVCAVIGFLIRRLVLNSASLRRMGLVLEVFIPIAYIILTYGLAFLADQVS